MATPGSLPPSLIKAVFVCIFILVFVGGGVILNSELEIYYFVIFEMKQEALKLPGGVPC